MPITVTRLLDEPIIRPHMDERMGDNINGPAVIRVPDWVDNPLGRYYLYFADHKGGYIRLAFADSVTGPWRMHEPGALDLSQSLFEPSDPPEPDEADRPAWARNLKGGYLYAHIASPDVHVDDEARCIRMYYHGLLWNGDQQTRIAYSDDGLNFEPREPLLGSPYFRVFEYDGFVYASAWRGVILRARHWDGPFDTSRQIVPLGAGGELGDGIRHAEVHRRGDRLHVFYTRIGDMPEGIQHAEVDLTRPFESWLASEPTTILEPELAWEGADLPLAASIMGGLDGPVRELRDPCVFQNADGTTYLFYCGAGESSIGLARIEGL